MTYAQKTVEERLQQIEDRMALKALVDEFSILADRKDVATQVLLFTEDAKVETMNNGQAVSALVGRKQIGDAFANFLALFEVVYHINGQQTVTIAGNKASGISYCEVTLVGDQNGKKMKTKMGVHYKDEYVKQNGKWLIANRQSTFAWRDVQPLGQ
ncbi:nuclear transport factor 2 family protein [Spirosoma linguale]